MTEIVGSPLHQKEFPNILTLHCTISFSLSTQIKAVYLSDKLLELDLA